MTTCHVKQFADTQQCLTCGQRWDYGDYEGVCMMPRNNLLIALGWLLIGASLVWWSGSSIIEFGRHVYTFGWHQAVLDESIINGSLAIWNMTTVPFLGLASLYCFWQHAKQWRLTDVEQPSWLQAFALRWVGRFGRATGWIREGYARAGRSRATAED